VQPVTDLVQQFGVTLSDEQTPKPRILGRERILGGGTKTLVSLRFSGCEQTAVFISPLRSSEGKPWELQLGTQEAFIANCPGKPLAGSSTEAPGGGLCSLSVDSEEALPKVPPHTF